MGRAAHHTPQPQRICREEERCQGITLHRHVGSHSWWRFIVHRVSGGLVCLDETRWIEQHAGWSAQTWRLHPLCFVECRAQQSPISSPSENPPRIAMKNILTSLFSPRKTSEDREAAPSPLGPKSALSSNKSRRRSLPEQKMERSVRFVGFLQPACASLDLLGSRC